MTQIRAGVTLVFLLCASMGCGDDSKAATVPTATFYQVSDAFTVPALGVLRRNVSCNPGDVATGGGYFLNTTGLADADLDVEVFSNAPIGDFGIEGSGWDIGIRNKAAVERSGGGFAVCYHGGS